MKEARFILPDIEPRRQQSLEDRLVRQFGGFTKSVVTVSWFQHSTQTRITSRGFAYDIAVDRDKLDTLRSILPGIARDFSQKELYFRNCTGEVHFIKPLKTQIQYEETIAF